MRYGGANTEKEDANPQIFFYAGLLVGVFLCTFGNIIITAFFELFDLPNQYVFLFIVAGLGILGVSAIGISQTYHDF